MNARTLATALSVAGLITLAGCAPVEQISAEEACESWIDDSPSDETRTLLDPLDELTYGQIESYIGSWERMGEFARELAPQVSQSDPELHGLLNDVVSSAESASSAASSLIGGDASKLADADGGRKMLSSAFTDVSSYCLSFRL